MQINKLTYKAQEAVAEAQKTAEDYNHQQVDTVHLLLSLIKQKDGIVPQILKRLGADITNIEKELTRELERIPRISGPGRIGQIYITPKLNDVFSAAEKEAEQLRDEYVSTEHILIALTEIDSSVSRIFKYAGI